MFSSLFSRKAPRREGTLNRRDLLKQGGLFGMAAALPATAAAAAPGTTAEAHAASVEMYRAIGVDPLINSKRHVHHHHRLANAARSEDGHGRGLPQLRADGRADGGCRQRLAEITGAEWGIVTAGCCAALTHRTAACIAGSNPERMQRLPDLTGLKSEVIIPEYSRNVYDHAIRMLGVKIIEVKTPDGARSGFQRTHGNGLHSRGTRRRGSARHPGGFRSREATQRPGDRGCRRRDSHDSPTCTCERGATAVAYSGGKCIRGPQAAGLLLGDKNLLQAAWANSAPHHAFGRSLKVGKEEIMGMLAAVEMWKKRDHDAEWKQWQGWLDEIATSVKRVNGVTTEVDGPEGLSNRSPRLVIQWDGAQLGITGQEVAKTLLDTEPRIVLGSGSGSRPDHMASTVSITPLYDDAG